jgi:hypothetical protein
MKRILVLAAVAALAGCSGQTPPDADQRQAAAQKQSLDSADREIGMPRIANYSQRKLLKNAYEDMDQTTLTYVYSQALDGRFVCLGQAVGYGVMGGTQFTSPTRWDWVGKGYGYLERPQPEPNGLFQPSSGAATIVNLINPATGEARTALVEPDVVTIPFKLPASAVAVPCPGDVDPATVRDAKETSVVKQR